MYILLYITKNQRYIYVSSSKLVDFSPIIAKNERFSLKLLVYTI